MSSMSIANFLATAPVLPREISLLLRGNHGIGKSQVVRQLATLANLPVIDRRLSQMTEGDMLGLPSIDGGVTRFNPPDWYQRACKEPVCLFLDELNRATQEVMQAAFQIVLDRELNGWRLHPETLVCAAVNSSASYKVNEIDPALLDRFWVVDLEPSVADWLNWARTSGVHTDIVDFITSNEKWLDSPKNSEPGSVQPSRRSWERLSRAISGTTLMETPGSQALYSLCLGFIGTEATITFTDYVKSVDARVSGEEILNKYPKVRDRLKKVNNQDKWVAAVEKLSEAVMKESKLTDAQGKNIGIFMEDLEGELRVSLWTKLTSAGVERMDIVKVIKKHCVQHVLKVFNVKEA